jgi:hypothetical protein
MAGEPGDGFVARWARRKQQVRSGTVVAPEPVTQTPLPVAEAPMAQVAVPAPVQPTPAAEPAPTLADVALLTRESDYARFVASGVDEGVKRAAMKKLFADPHFNVMDGLDTYIADYGQPDPIPLAMLRRMNQSKFLRLFEDDEDDAERPPAEAPHESLSATDDDADLRLQQDDAAGRTGPDQGTGA